MVKHHTANRYKRAKPSRLLALTAFIIACALPYVLVTHFGQKIPSYANQSIDLPQLEEFEEESTNEETATSSLENKHWQTLTTKSGDTLGSLFMSVGLSSKTLQQVLQGNPHAKTLTTIKPHQTFQFLIVDGQLEELTRPISATALLTVSRQGQRYYSHVYEQKMTSHNQYITATVQGSLFGTAKRMKIPYPLIRQMTEIFKGEIDFARDVRAGDQFTIIYKAYFNENKLVKTGEIVAVTYTNRGKAHHAIFHQHANGETGYYTPQGNSLKKAFSRYPIKFSHISSTFSLSRMHPILQRRRPHHGIDLAAPIGTPIRAVGDGKVISIGRNNGYGNMIKIAHNRTDTTIYAHMLKFQKGLSQGDRVKQGQVIGYVGQSGLASGPHCHFEFRINGQPKNPTTVNLPRASPILHRELAGFQANATALLAHMKLYEEAHLAQKKSADAPIKQLS